jgi:hypothetical protein
LESPHLHEVDIGPRVVVVVQNKPHRARPWPRVQAPRRGSMVGSPAPAPLAPPPLSACSLALVSTLGWIACRIVLARPVVLLLPPWTERYVVGTTDRYVRVRVDGPSILPSSSSVAAFAHPRHGRLPASKTKQTTCHDEVRNWWKRIDSAPVSWPLLSLLLGQCPARHGMWSDEVGRRCSRSQGSSSSGLCRRAERTCSELGTRRPAPRTPQMELRVAAVQTRLISHHRADRRRWTPLMLAPPPSLLPVSASGPFRQQKQNKQTY